MISIIRATGANLVIERNSNKKIREG